MLDENEKEPEEICQTTLPSNFDSQSELRATQRAVFLLLLFAVSVVLAVICGYIGALCMLADGLLALVWLGVSMVVLGFGAMIILFPPRKR